MNLKSWGKILVVFLGILGLTIIGCSKKSSTEPDTQKPDADYEAPKAAVAPVIDGVADDACWQNAEWGLMDQLYIGQPATEQDFSGRYKIVWDADKLYILFEITDDYLSDVRTNPLDGYWQDDCLEFFIDEDASGGDHTYNYNAFAYHIALDYQAVDIGTDRSPHLYSDHLTGARQSTGNVRVWEVALTVYTSAYQDAFGTLNPKAELKSGKLIGYVCAYCDADQSGDRENFYGSVFIAGAVGEERNKAWQTADVFGKLLLVD